MRTYTRSCISRYPLLTRGKGEQALAVQQMLDKPLQLFLKTEGPDRDQTWIQSLPTEASRGFMKHVVELNQGLFRPEIQGALQRSAAEKFCLEKFHHTSRVNARFVAAFRVAYDSLAASTHETEAVRI